MALDALLPPLCLSCGEVVAEPGSLCPACWESVSFLGDPQCSACGEPFEYEIGTGSLCGRCTQNAPPWGRARAVFRYDDGAKALILRFKHADRIEGAPAFARWMARAGAELLDQCDVIVPVPLHRWRLLARRYNQAALLAQHLSRLSGRSVEPEALIRLRSTASMGHLKRDERRKNVKNAFILADRLRPAIEGSAVLLVDDVLTTGATVGECARVLLGGGARSVDVLTLGRVVL